MKLKSILRATLFAASLAATAAIAAYPDQPIRLIVPLAAGGGGDTAARSVAEHLSQKLKQPVIVENRPGAGTAIGNGAVARASPDGYTLLLFAGDIAAIDKAYNNSLPYDPVNDFTLISGIAGISLVLVANPNTGITSLQDLVAKARAEPGKLNFGSLGSSSPHFLFFEWFKKQADLDIADIPYKSTAQATSDLFGGQIDLTMFGEVNASNHAKAGKLLPIANTGQHRGKIIPDIPTFSEFHPDLVMENWYALAGPAGLPHEVITTLHEAVSEALALPATTDKLGTIGLSPWSMPPENLKSHMDNEVQKYAEIIRISGAQPAGR